MQVTLSADLFVRSLRAVSLAASDDYTRPHLASVRIGYDPEALDFDAFHSSFSLCATNGHILFQHTVDRADLAHLAIAPATGSADKPVNDPVFALVSAVDCATLLRTIGKKPDGAVELTLTGGTVTVRTYAVTVTYRTVDAQFPPVEQVMPRAWSRVPLADRGCYCVSADYLATVAKAVSALAPKARADGLLFDYGNSLDPVRITADTPDARGFVAIIMPIKSDNGGTRPVAFSASKGNSADAPIQRDEHRSIVAALRESHSADMSRMRTEYEARIDRMAMDHSADVRCAIQERAELAKVRETLAAIKRDPSSILDGEWANAAE